jgi:hypothetical protein
MIRIYRMAVALLVVAGGQVATSPTVRATPSIECSSRADQATCDIDGDGIPDAVEEEVCGLITCADGTEDVDGDSVPDWLEVVACDDVRCADPTLDTDRLGIPDWLERLTCGSPTCADGTEDLDGDGVADWLEWLLCGSAACADEAADLDRNGARDVVELRRTEVTIAPSRGRLVDTGGDPSVWLWVGAGALVVGIAATTVARRRGTRS